MKRADQRCEGIGMCVDMKKGRWMENGYGVQGFVRRGGAYAGGGEG